MTFGLAPGKLGFKIGDVLVGLQSGTTDTPETISSTQNKLHTLGYAWNPDSLAYEVVTTGGSGTGLEVTVTNASLSTTPYEIGGDAGGRTRVSQLTTLYDGKKLNADEAYRWTSVGTGTVTFSQNKAVMDVTAGQYAVRQSPHWNPYFSGKPQFIEATFDNFHPLHPRRCDHGRRRRDHDPRGLRPGPGRRGRRRSAGSGRARGGRDEAGDEQGYVVNAIRMFCLTCYTTVGITCLATQRRPRRPRD